MASKPVIQREKALQDVFKAVQPLFTTKEAEIEQ